MLRYLFAVLAIAWACVIFAMSARNAELSTEDSNGVGYIIGRILYSDFDEWPDYKQEAFEDDIDHTVRKAAHVTEYILLGVFLAGAFYKKQKGSIRFNVLVPFIVGALYAVSDEIHQYFVPGRSMQISDMAIDFCGVLVGVVIVVYIYFRRNLKKLKAEE